MTVTTAEARTRQSATNLLTAHVDASQASLGLTGLGISTAIAEARFDDRLMITGTPAQAGQLVTLHNVLGLRTVLQDHSERLIAGTPQTTSVGSSTSLDIFSTGIATGSGPFGGNNFGGFQPQIDSNGSDTQFDHAAPLTIDFTQTFIWER